MNASRARLRKILDESAALLRLGSDAYADADAIRFRRSKAYELFLSQCRLERKTYRRLRRRVGLEKEEIRFVRLRQMPGWFENLSICSRVAARLHGLSDVPGFAEISEGVWMLDVPDFEGWSFLAQERDGRGNVSNLVNFRSPESGYSKRVAGRSPDEQISKEDLCRFLDRHCYNFWRGRGAEPEWILERHDPETIEYCVDRIFANFKYSPSLKTENLILQEMQAA
jgi:hypothetical protein